MITQQEWDKFSSHTHYISQNFNRVNILQVICKNGIDGGLPLYEVWPQGVTDYSFKMRFRKTNRNKGSIFVFNDFCVNNEPLSQLSVAYREYNASIFGIEYAKQANEYLQDSFNKEYVKFNTNVVNVIRARANFLDEFYNNAKRLRDIAKTCEFESQTLEQ